MRIQEKRLRGFGATKNRDKFQRGKDKSALQKKDAAPPPIEDSFKRRGGDVSSRAKAGKHVLDEEEGLAYDKKTKLSRIKIYRLSLIHRAG